MKRKEKKTELYRICNVTVCDVFEVSKARFYYYCRKYQNSEDHTWFRELRETANTIEHYFEFCEK